MSAEGYDITSAVEIEVYRPDFALSRLFSRRDIDSHIDIPGVFIPAWDLCFSNPAYTRRRGRRVRIQGGIVLADDAQIGGHGRAICDIVVVQLDKGRIESINDGGMDGTAQRRLGSVVGIMHAHIVDVHVESGRRMAQTVEFVLYQAEAAGQRWDWELFNAGKMSIVP